MKIKKQIESLELTNNKLTENLDKNYMNMLKGIIDEEQYIRVSENIKNEISNNKKNIDNLICQSNKNIYELRKNVCKLGYFIINEEIIFEDKFKECK